MAHCHILSHEGLSPEQDLTDSAGGHRRDILPARALGFGRISIQRHDPELPPVDVHGMPYPVAVFRNPPVQQLVSRHSEPFSAIEKGSPLTPFAESWSASEGAGPLRLRIRSTTLAIIGGSVLPLIA
jgi:hypothetical protein